MDSLYFSSLALFRGLTFEPMFSLSLCQMHADTNTHTHAHTLTLLASRVCEVAASTLSCWGGQPPMLPAWWWWTSCTSCLNCWGSICCHNSYSRSFLSGAESRVPNRGDGAAVRGDDKIKQQNGYVPICVEALLLHNSGRKSHYRRIIAALSLWVLRVVIHNIPPHPCFLSVWSEVCRILLYQSKYRFCSILLCFVLCHGCALPVQQHSRWGL